MDVDVAVKKSKYSRCEAKLQVNKARSKTRVNLSLTFSRFRALKKRLGMKSNAELACFLFPNTGGKLVLA